MNDRHRRADAAPLAYAFHTGGANTLRCDGSVMFMSESMSAPVLIAFITRNGGEVMQTN